MTVTSDPGGLYSDKNKSYLRFVRAVLYPQAIHAYFLGSPLLRCGLRVLDAGCGSGIVILALRDALLRRGLAPGPSHAFDLTPAMLEHFQHTLESKEIRGIELEQADVLTLNELPTAWSDYDLIVSASMLEYVPKENLSAGLAGLRCLLKEDGSLVLFITRRNWLTRPLIGRWWRANLYDRAELEHALQEAGYSSTSFHQFPAQYRYLALWGYIIEAHK
jgi:cyclopropane fatty-acyl-phospholipid synthase-like methyltransferase|tara:strand:+ start:1135 stop:1791 length:657 start_codon:yes stop_codon:yes gene_type:complete